jgi:hypothetical protein
LGFKVTRIFFWGLFTGGLAVLVDFLSLIKQLEVLHIIGMRQLIMCWNTPGRDWLCFGKAW